MNIDKKLTILLVVKDRGPYTLRWISLANRTSMPFKVLIADGGKDERVCGQLSKHANFPNVYYKYIKYPYDLTYSHFYAKMTDILSKVDTPFVVVADDASCFLINGLRRSVEFLYTHQDYSACGGNIGSFLVLPDDKKGQLNPAYGEEIRFWSNLYPFQQISNETAGARVANHFALYCPTYYDVHRVEQLSLYFNVLKEINLKDIFLAELLTSFLTACSGKIRRGPYLYMLRQRKDHHSSAGAHREKWGDAFDRMLLESWSGDFTKFANAIALEISHQDGVSIDDARLQVKRSYRMHIAPQIIEKLSIQNEKEKQSIIIENMKNLVRKLKYDNVLRRFIQETYVSIRAIGNNKYRNLPIHIHKSSEFYEDIKPIEDFLTSG